MSVVQNFSITVWPGPFLKWTNLKCHLWLMSRLNAVTVFPYVVYLHPCGVIWSSLALRRRKQLTLSQKVKSHSPVDFQKVLRRISYGAGRRTFHTWLAPILPTEKRVGALGPIRVVLKDPWGWSCHSQVLRALIETWRAVQIPTWGRLRGGSWQAKHDS